MEPTCIPPTQDADWFKYGLDNSLPTSYPGVAASPVPYPNDRLNGLADTLGPSGLYVPPRFPYPGVAASPVPFAIGHPNNDQFDAVASPVSFSRHQRGFSPTSTPMQFQNFDSLWHDVGPISEEQFGEPSTHNRQYEPTHLSASGYIEEEAPILICQGNTPSQIQLDDPRKFPCLNQCDGNFIGPHWCFRYGTEVLISCRYQNCSYKHSFRAKGDFNQHYKSFHLKLLIDCPVEGCSRVGVKGFSRKDNLLQHRRGVHGEEIRKKNATWPERFDAYDNTS